MPAGTLKPRFVEDVRNATARPSPVKDGWLAFWLPSAPPVPMLRAEQQRNGEACTPSTDAIGATAVAIHTIVWGNWKIFWSFEAKVTWTHGRPNGFCVFEHLLLAPGRTLMSGWNESDGVSQVVFEHETCWR